MIARVRRLSQLLPSPTLLVTESKDRLDQIRQELIEEIDPCGIVEYMFVDEISHIVWDILRFRRCWTAIISLALPAAIEKLAAELLRRPGEYPHQYRVEAEKLAYKWFSDQKGRSKVLQLLQRRHLDEDALEAEAIRSCAPDLKRLDKLLVSLELRRSRALRGIAEYRTDLALKLQAGSDRIIDGKVLAVGHTEAKELPAAA